MEETSTGGDQLNGKLGYVVREIESDRQHLHREARFAMMN
jgi:hypothetical protein